MYIMLKTEFDWLKAPKNGLLERKRSIDVAFQRQTIHTFRWRYAVFNWLFM